VTYTLIVPNSFRRQAKKFLKAHPDLRETVGTVLRALEDDPFQPQLQLHPLSGNLAGCHAVCVTYSYHITVILQITEREIILLDIGSHDDVHH
jgi:mRNA-degrading endonuclease YafQ of YafQ-DinJ toxin-antitoxin module